LGFGRLAALGRQLMRDPLGSRANVLSRNQRTRLKPLFVVPFVGRAALSPLGIGPSPCVERSGG
jgi:hypothetical protein